MQNLIAPLFGSQTPKLLMNSPSRESKHLKLTASWITQMKMEPTICDLCCPGKHGSICKPKAFPPFKVCKMDFRKPITFFIFYEVMQKVIF